MCTLYHVFCLSFYTDNTDFIVNQTDNKFTWIGKMMANEDTIYLKKRLN